MKLEAVLCIANLVEHTNREECLNWLLNQNLIGIIHDELREGPDHGPLHMVLLQCLSKIFEYLPRQKTDYLNCYGTDVLERLQYSPHEQVHEAVIEFLEQHFECEDQNECIDDLNDLEDEART